MDISVYCQPINMPKRGDTTIIQSHCQSPRTHLQCFCQFPTCIHSFLHSSFLLSFTPSFIPTLPIHYSSAILSLTHTHDTQIHFLLCRSINFLTIKTYFKACYTQNALLSSPKLDCRDAISKHPKLWILSSRQLPSRPWWPKIGAECVCLHHYRKTYQWISMKYSWEVGHDARNNW